MADAELLALIHAEIDGELDVVQRGELARRLLADPAARALRDELRDLCARLDGVGQVDPPDELSARILRALPSHAAPLRVSRWPAQRWRYAALAAGVVAGIALVLHTVHGPNPSSTDLAGTMAPPQSGLMLDTTTVAGAAIAGRVSLYREPAGLTLTFELQNPVPVDVVVAGGGRRLRARVGPSAGGAPERTSVALPGFGSARSRTLDLTFVASGHEVGRATLRVPDDR